MDGWCAGGCWFTVAHQRDQHGNVSLTLPPGRCFKVGNFKARGKVPRYNTRGTAGYWIGWRTRAGRGKGEGQMTILAGITTQKELWIAGEDPLDGKPITDGHWNYSPVRRWSLWVEVATAVWGIKEPTDRRRCNQGDEVGRRTRRTAPQLSCVAPHLTSFARSLALLARSLALPPGAHVFWICFLSWKISAMASPAGEFQLFFSLL